MLILCFASLGWLFGHVDGCLSAGLVMIAAVLFVELLRGTQDLGLTPGYVWSRMFFPGIPIAWAVAWFVSSGLAEEICR